ncbi:MAG: radical SAM protein [Candidatus Diapherotrites archaeon]|uniref:Radical SAM protein n=1 Tax=Candidatus Iainarchaeum sp. TaxID=3101447 RepID=A0A938YSP1_9ARCH|nr:radical SAM protein [Candidatus Diapherotrites archaeon]
MINDLGRWVVLSKKELEAVQKNSVGSALLKKLESGGMALSKKGQSQLVKDYRVRYGHLFHPVSLHIVNPTNRCSQSCLYCYSNSQGISSKKKGLDMSPETARKTIDFIWQTPSNGFVVEFQGGEPLANFPAIQEMVGYAKSKRPKKKVHWRLVSNLTLMDNDIASFLKKNNITDVCTSLDGPKELHDANRPMHGSSYEKAVYWINALRSDFGFKQIGALCTVTRKSLPFAKQIVDEYLKLGLPDVTAVSLRKIGRAKPNWQKIGYSPAQFFGFWREMVDYCIALNRKGIPVSEQTCSILLRKILSPERISHTCYSKPCGAALMQCSFQPDGSIYSCDEGKAESLFKIGSIAQSYKSVFASPAALNLVSLSSGLGLYCNNCKWTGFCRLCPVTTYAEQHSLIPVLPELFECRLKMLQFPYLFEKLFSNDAKILEKWSKKAAVA